MKAKEYEKAIVMFKMGFAPSQVDKMLALKKGTTHDLMVRLWIAEKDGALQDRAA